MPKWTCGASLVPSGTPQITRAHRQRLRLHIPDAHYLPKSLRDTIQVFSLGATRLDIKGAQAHGCPGVRGSVAPS